MLSADYPSVAEIRRLHAETVTRWHGEALNNPYAGFLWQVCHQHQFNFLLWHEEDRARSPEATDARIAAVKRTIDAYNQQRNDWIEKLDESLQTMLAAKHLEPRIDLPLNTETPGAAIDRLSIMAIRIYHLREELLREDADEEHRTKVGLKLDRCNEQLEDLSVSLSELLDDLWLGRKRLKIYRHLKMYNDPTLNPYLYRRDNDSHEKRFQN